MYDASVGRWNGVDALASHPNQIELSPFNYAWNNPIKLTDPDGNCPLCALIAKGAIEALFEAGSQLLVNTAMNGGDVLQAANEIDGADVLLAFTAGMASPSPGSGRVAVNIKKGIRIASEVAKPLVDASLEDGVQTVGGDKSFTEVVVDASVGLVSSSVSLSTIDGARRATSESLTPSNYAPLNKVEKQVVKAEDALANSKGFSRTVSTIIGVVTSSTGEIIKQALPPAPQASPLNMGAPRSVSPSTDATMIAPIVRPLNP